MRQLFLLVSIFCGINDINAQTNANSSMLDGTWIPTTQEMGGKQLPAAAFEKQKLILDDSAYTVVAESIDKGIARFQNGKIDIYGKEGVNKGRHFTAIYKYENDLLIICYNLKGDKYPELYDTKGNPLYFMSVFKKE